MRFVHVLALAGLVFGLMPAGAAEVWGYVDERGTAHFASEQLDQRYELFSRGDQQPEAGPALDMPRPAAVPTTASRLIAFFEVSPAYRQVKHHLREAAQSHGVDQDLLTALIATESGFDPAAVSPKGAVGLMQVMPATALRWGVSGDARTTVGRQLTDPRTNLRAGTRYLRHLLDLFPGRLDLALAAYNAGEGAVQRAGNKVPNYRETQAYVRTVMQLYSVLRPPSTLSGSRVAGRIRVEIPAGGAAGRGNLPAMKLPPPATAPSLAVAIRQEVDFQRD